MRPHLIETYFDYSCHYIPRSYRRSRTAILKSPHWISIGMVDAASAPIAYNIIPPDNGDPRFEVRLLPDQIQSTG